MRRTRSTENLVALVNKIEHFLRERCQILRQQEIVDQVVDTKPYKKYVIPTKEESHCSIVHLPNAVNNFELKPSLIGMVQQNQFLGCPLRTQTFIYLSLLKTVVLQRLMVLTKTPSASSYSLSLWRIVRGLAFNLARQFDNFMDSVESNLPCAVFFSNQNGPS